MQSLAHCGERALKTASSCFAVSHSSTATASVCHAQRNGGNKGLKPQSLTVLSALFKVANILRQLVNELVAQKKIIIIKKKPQTVASVS